MNTHDGPLDPSRYNRPADETLVNEQRARIRELTRWTVRLAAALRIGLPRSHYPDDAMHYLEQNGLVKRPLSLPRRSIAVPGTRSVQ